MPPIDVDSAACMVLASNYDQSCSVDSDCAMVFSGNCCVGGCFCGGSAINARAFTQFAADVARAEVGVAPGPICGCPAEFNPCCIAGKCEAGYAACVAPPSDTLAALCGRGRDLRSVHRRVRRERSRPLELLRVPRRDVLPAVASRGGMRWGRHRLRAPSTERREPATGRRNESLVGRVGPLVEAAQRRVGRALSLDPPRAAEVDELVIVGGLVPSLIIDQTSDKIDKHVGTLDLDVGMQVAILDNRRYEAMTERLRAAGFGPDTNETGSPTRQRWKIDGPPKVTLDFLIPPSREGDRGGGLRDIEADFAAIIAPGLRLAFLDSVTVSLAGRTIRGEQARRDIRVSGAGAFVAMKALALRGRGENKDAYDLVYVLRNFGTGPVDTCPLVSGR
jgi:hypothetical protein